jgi:hypothetical protein
MTVRNSEAEYTGQPLKGLSFDRLTCLLRHWAWADEARQRFERELAAFPDDSTPGSAGNPDRILGAYYHWCAMLCALGDAAEGDALIDYAPLDSIRDDLQATLAWLRACRKRLVDVPSSSESHPTLADLHRDKDTLRRLRRIHRALGDAFRIEQVSREVDSLDH